MGGRSERPRPAELRAWRQRHGLTQRAAAAAAAAAHGLAAYAAVAELIAERDALRAALIAFRDGGPSGGRDFAEWHSSYSNAIDMARAALAMSDGKMP